MSSYKVLPHREAAKTAVEMPKSDSLVLEDNYMDKEHIEEKEKQPMSGYTNPAIPLTAPYFSGHHNGHNDGEFAILGQLIGFTNAQTNNHLTTKAVHDSTIANLHDSKHNAIAFLQESKHNALETAHLKADIERGRLDTANLKAEMMGMIGTIRTELQAAQAETKATLLAQEISNKNALIDRLEKELFFLKSRLAPSPTPTP